MPLLDRIAECTTHDLSRFVPFRVGGRDLGWVGNALADSLRDMWSGEAGVFSDAPGRLELDPSLEGFDERSEAMARVVADLRERGVVPRLAEEWYPVVADHGEPPALRLARAAMPTFGARAFGVHMHGYVRRPDGLHLWVARRSRTKATFPGMLDNLVAGGQPLGLSLRENLAKECAEEADIPASLAARAVLTGRVSYRMEIERGLRNDTLFLFDLELPEDFVPRNTDGEVESFELWPAREVLARIERAPDFKFNCHLTLIDFLLRHGVVDAAHPEHDAVRAALPVEDVGDAD